MNLLVSGFYCEKCWYVYDSNIGDPEHGISPGTDFEDLPDKWVCPDCGIDKKSFSTRTQRQC
ncbi:Rubredoxin-2 [compost metagenome]